jgi:hypothetical protein
VQRLYPTMQLRCRQMLREQRPEQQSVSLPQPSASSPQTVSQRLLVQRRLQQSEPVRHREPTDRQSVRHTPVNPLTSQVLPWQQGSAPRPQERPGRLQDVDDRQVPAVQFPEQQSRFTVQSMPLFTQVGLGVWQVPAVQESPAQQPDPQGMPEVAQTTGSWQVPAVQVSPAQQPDPQGIPADPHTTGAWQVPAVQVSPAQQPDPQGIPADPQVELA